MKRRLHREMNRGSATFRPIVAVVVLASVLASGCGLFMHHETGSPDQVATKARFYWSYAALATDVYRTRGETDHNMAIAVASPWLRAEIEALTDEPLKKRLRQDLVRKAFPEEATLIYRAKLQKRCVKELQMRAADGNSLATPSCVAEADLVQEAEGNQTSVDLEPNLFINQEPKSNKECQFGRGKKPSVWMDEVGKGPHGWTRVRELRKVTAARGWRLFVPELAIEVWRRTRSLRGKPLEIEYAIVYRGTVGGGGWISNLRGLTAMLPLVWDQYRQAEFATDLIIDQIDRLHTLGDSLLERAEPTELRFTAVGHSLGGGLAQYIYIKKQRITRVVAFAPSPINGASLIPIGERESVTSGGRRFVDLDPRDDRAAIHLLYEKGEFISKMSPCRSGRVWGAEGGPWVNCESVNFSGGNAFRQHNMAQLACHLYLHQR